MDSDEEFFMSSSVFELVFTKKSAIHEINKNRREKGEFYMLYDELRNNPEKFKNYTRMTIATFDYILGKIEKKLQKCWTSFNKIPILACEKLIITLRYLGTGPSFTSLAYSFRMGRSTVSVIVKETVIALWEALQPTHMPQPTKNSTEQVAKKFWQLWNFPNCAGAIDGKHIRLQCPAHSGSMFYNYKKFYSLVLQAVADADCKFITIEVGGYGKQSDGGTFNSSELFQQMKTRQFLPPDTQLPGTNILMPYVLIGDEAYPLLDNLLRPYARRDCNANKEYFNSRLSRARRCVECAFGIMTAKWRLLWKPIETSPDYAENVVKAICVLHNAIIDLEGTSNTQQEMNDMFANDVTNERVGVFNPINLTTGQIVRDTFRDFVCANI